MGISGSEEEAAKGFYSRTVYNPGGQVQRRRFFLFVTFTCGILNGARAQQATPVRETITSSVPNASQLTREQMEDFLRTARITSERPAGKGVTHARRVTMTDGHWIHDAHIQDIDVFKPLFRTPEGLERNFRDSYKFNIAAYLLDKMMNINMIPVCVYREVDGKPSAASWWVDSVMFDEEGRRAAHSEPPDLNYWSRQLNEVRNFDQLISNEDRNQGNLLIDHDWRVWMIDHSRAFRDDLTPRNPDVLRRCSQKFLDALKALNEQQLQATLMPWITQEDIRTMLLRRDWLVHFFENKVSTEGKEAIFTDMPVKTPQVTIP